jgi:nucleoside-diphosphate-sugar epimerase
MIVRPGSDLRQLDPVRDKLTLHVYDGSTDGLLRIVADSQPSIVFHLAAMTIAEHHPVDVVPLLSASVIFGTQLAEAMSVAKVSCLVNASTFWQHYATESYSPTCLYAAAKQAFESLLQYYVDMRGLNTISLVLYDIYGPHDPRQKLFRLLSEAATTQSPVALSPGEQLVEMLYIDDVVDAFVTAGHRLLDGLEKGHRRFAVSTGHPVSLKEIVKVYEEVRHDTVPVQWGGRAYREREVMVPWQGEHLPGWTAATSLREGIKQLLDSESKLFATKKSDI